MSLGVSIVELFSADDHHDPYDIFSNEISEQSRYGSFFYCTDPLPKPKLFTDYEFNTDALVNFKAQEDAARSYHNLLYDDANLKLSKIVVVGDGLATLRLVDVFAEFKNVIVFNSTSDEKENAKLENADYYILAFSSHLEDEEDAERSNISELKSALDIVEPFLQSSATVIIESRIRTGTTRLLLEPLIRSKRIKGGISPKCASPHNRFDSVSTPSTKLIAGLDDLMPGSLASIHSLYTVSYPHVISVSSPEVAEMASLNGDEQPMIATAYANEMADACAPVGIDPFEVCSVLSRSPLSSEPSTPIMGMGGLYAGSIFNYISSVAI